MNNVNEGSARPAVYRGYRLLALAEQLRSLARERDRVMAMPPYRGTRDTEGTK
jgi:hypothetical protein